MLRRPAPAVEVEVLLDLRLALALGGLVDRELHAPAAVGHDLRHQRRVLGRDRLVGEVDHLGHAEDALVVADPLLHVAELDVARPRGRCPQQTAGRRARSSRASKPGRNGAVVAAALDEQVERVAVGGDRRQPHAAVLVRRSSAAWRRRARRARPPAGRRPRRRARSSAILCTPSPWCLWCSPISSVAGRACRSARAGCGPARARARRGRGARSRGRVGGLA